MSPARPQLLSPLLCLALAAFVLAGTAMASTEATNPKDTAPLIKREQQRMLMQKARAKFARMSEHAIELRKQMIEAAEAEERSGGQKASEQNARETAPERIIRKKPSDDWREPGGAQGTQHPLRVVRRAEPTDALGSFVPPADVIVNNRAGDAFGAGQCEQDLAAHGNNIVVAWNDGQGYNDGTGDTQGYAYSINGGTTWTDGGKLPKPAGFPTFIWTSDPLVSVNENTGEFYYLGLCSPSSGTNGVAFIRGTFGGGVLNWDAPVIIRSESNFQFFIDKPWMVADSSSGNIYMSYTEFNLSGDEINFRRSINNGATWSSDFKINLPVDDGYVQGSRPVVGPQGHVYVFWYTIGAVDLDFMKMRRSINGGVSFEPEIIAASMYANFGTGAPGFNRDMGIQFPSVAVDRVEGSATNGRIYLTWNETVNWYDDGLGGGGSRSEVESNNTFGTANPFTIGQRLRGSLVGSDIDNFSFTANQGQTYIFWSDSLPASNFDYSMRVYCTDQITRLAYSGGASFPSANGFIVWTAPATGTYYLRMTSLDGAENGGYRIQTGINGGAVSRGRDQRDVFVTASSNGGTSWTTPSRVNADEGRYDNWLPEIEVGLAGGDAHPYVIWYDWRDAASSCAGMSHVYLARSDNSGGSWTELGALTSVQTDWTNVQSNIQPNQGDYLGLYPSDTHLYASWADGRNADPDVFISVIPLASTPVLISLASVTAETDRVKLAWFSGGDPLGSADVQRRTADTDWQTVATIAPDGSDLLHYEDTNVTPGVSYGYRLHIEDGEAQRFVGETWIEVPSTASLGIASIHPNPTTANAFITFSLESGAAATLQLIDVAGRVVRDVDLGGYGAGNHTVNLGSQGRLQPGVYVVRLTQGGRSVTSRLSVVR